MQIVEYDQKFMAWSGLVTWSGAVIRLGKELDDPSFAPFVFAANRHLFVVACHNLVQHIKWAIELSLIERKGFSAILNQQNHIRILRNLNEHTIEYYQGRGDFRKDWVYVTPKYSADATSTVCGRLGGRLDYRQIVADVQKMQTILPSMPTTIAIPTVGE